MLALTIRDILWLVLVAWLAIAWRLDAQVKELEYSDKQDTAALFLADNAILERENAKHRARIQRLEARIAQAKLGGS